MNITSQVTLSPSKFPIEIVQHILRYDGRFKYRNGKFMTQIAQEDDRYHMLEKMPQIIPSSRHSSYMTITSYEKNFIYEKYMVAFSEKVPLVLIKMNDMVTQYIFTKHYIGYRFTLYRTPPTFFEYLLQHFYKYFYS